MVPAFGLSTCCGRRAGTVTPSAGHTRLWGVVGRVDASVETVKVGLRERG